MKLDTKVRIPSDRDYADELHTENGFYRHTCIDCDKMFYGHKRRKNM